jgi:DNA-binding MarR family transcriptional regulator
MQRLNALLNEVRLLWHVLVQQGERLLADQPVTLAKRGVLEYLERRGAATVPRIAHSRRVTRQHIQVIVNGLSQQRWVRLRENPAHKRSALVELTPRGQQAIAAIRAREAQFLSGLPFKVSGGDLKQARKVLRSVRNTLEGKDRS